MPEEKPNVLAIAAALGGTVKENFPGHGKRVIFFQTPPPAGDGWVLTGFRPDELTGERVFGVELEPAPAEKGREPKITVNDSWFSVSFPQSLVHFALGDLQSDGVRVEVVNAGKKKGTRVNTINPGQPAPRPGRLFAGERQQTFADAAAIMLKLARTLNADSFPWSHAPRVTARLLAAARTVEAFMEPNKAREGVGVLPGVGESPSLKTGITR